MLLTVVVALVVLVVVGLLVAGALGQRRMRALFDADEALLLAQTRGSAQRHVPEPATELPEPVRRFVQGMAVPGRAVPRVVRLVQTGQLRSGLDKPWVPFSAQQTYALDPPGFVWLARARLAPLVPMWALDEYVAGRGSMRIRLLGLAAIADARGPELDRGAGLRFWGEILALPEVVLDPRLTWQPRGPRRAHVTIADGPLTFEADVDFDDAGRPIAFHAERHRDTPKGAVLTPWSGHFGAWKDFRGRAFPSQWESVWHLPEGDFPAVRIEVVDVTVDGP